MRLLSLLCLLLTAATANAGERLTVGGIVRTYELISATPGRAKPLIIALHGNKGTGAQFASYGKWAELAARSGVLIALPDGLNKAWRDGRAVAELRGNQTPPGTDDVAFIVMLAERLVAEGLADRKRLYVAGISNGGMMTFRLLCDRPDLFAAGAAVIASLTETSLAGCKPSQPVPVLIMNGTEDKLVPHERQQGGYLGTVATAAFWQKINGCTGMADERRLPDLDTADKSTVTRIAYGCPAGRDVVVYRVDGGGHQMPSRTGAGILEFLLGPRNRDIEAAEEIWAFVSRFSR